MLCLGADSRLLLRSTLVAASVAACTFVTQKPALLSPEQAPAPGPDAPSLKVHMRSGALYLLANWQVIDSSRLLLGTGARYDALRARQDSGPYTIAVDSIALVETNAVEYRSPFGFGMLGTLTVVYGVASIACLADPKSCFGSCPTFYVDNGSGEVLQAEGFSSSIARVLEASDVDPLYGARPTQQRFTVAMRNEALETHVVRSVRLQAVRRPAAGQVFASREGRHYPATLVTAPTACRAAEGDCLSAVSSLDTVERRSLADSTDLAARETVELEFPAGPGPHGLVLGARHTLVSTFVFYQTLAHMGRQAGEWLAALERGGPELASQSMRMMHALGGIEIAIAERDGSWRVIGTYDEAGPIATDVQVFPLGAAATGGTIHIRLRMARGSWRLGYTALARLGDPAMPLTLEPVAVERRGISDTAALAALADTGRYLTTYPGDAYAIVFDLPQDYGAYDLFLESRGYYYEWMRAEWLQEENAAMVALAMIDPAAALRRLAPSFKRSEPTIEALFWQSRFGRVSP